MTKLVRLAFGNACATTLSCLASSLALGFGPLASAAEKTALPEFLVRSWDSEDGLPSAPVRAIARTPDGYLWVATERGLARFDGVRFVTLTTNTPALGDNSVICLLLDGRGDLWAGTQGGTLAHCREGVWRSVPLGEQMRGIRINDLAQDENGALWLATQGAGLAQYRDGKCTFAGAAEGVPSDVVSCLTGDSR